MQAIELECPQCKILLELDAGFAGGVCRCSNCGTLMTVPADPSRERAETLTRPDRPGGRSRPQRPVGAGSRPDSPRRPGTSAAASAAPPGPVESVSGGGGDAETLVTASGKRVKVSKKLSIPMARKKRKAIRAGVVAVFMVLAGLLAVGLGFAIYTVTRPTPPPGQAPGPQAVGFDAEANPFTLAKPNFLGLSLGKKTVITIDASSSSRGWLSVVAEAVFAGTRNLPADSSVQVIVWMEGGFASFPSDQPKRLTADYRESLKTFLDGVTARGSADPGLALDKAFSSGPDQVILTTGKPLDASQLSKLRELMKATPQVKVDAVVIGDDIPELRDIVEQSGGRYNTPSKTRLGNWYSQAQDKATESR